MHRVTAFLLALMFGLAANALTFEAEVTHVTDGDTLWVRSARGAPRQVRLRGIDAPELCQSFGPQARDVLAGHVLHRRVAVTLSGKDDYQRWLGTIRIGGEDISARLVSGGYAWAHRWHRRAGPYGALEAQARTARRGLWAERAPLEPREFRKLHGSCH